MMWEGLTKNGAKKQKIKNSSPSARKVALGEEAPSPSADAWHSWKRSPSPSARAWHSGMTFFKFLANGSVQYCRQMQTLG
jgi:hypothetical protein